MAHEEVYAALKSTGCPFAHMAWPKGSAPPLPWGVYYLDSETPLPGDDDSLAVRREWFAELYESARDPELEENVAAALESIALGPVTRGESWVDTENCLMTTFRFNTLEG